MSNPMPASKTVTLTVDSEKLQRFCSRLVGRSRDVARTHDALVTLEAFIVAFGRAAHGTPEYSAIEQILQHHTEGTRQQLLQEKSVALEDVLRRCSAHELAAIHAPLSRNGFHQIFQDAVAGFNDDEIAAIRAWSGEWVEDARQRAGQASGYPDALDFNKAGIRIEEYQAMSDVSRFLEGQGS